MVGIGRGARAGILIREAAALELAARIDWLGVDKTGTLTEGKPEVTELAPTAGTSDDRLLAIAASLAQGSAHPLSQAIARAARERGIARLGTAKLETIPGRGVRGEVEAVPALMGSPSWLEDNGIVTDGSVFADAQGRARTLVAVAHAGRALGFIMLADRLRPGAAEAIARLRVAGIEVAMLTGDHESAARAIAARVGIDAVHAALLPQDKSAEIARQRALGRITAMVGDGINDAPALAAADVSFALGAGADVAMQAAAVTLVRNDLGAVADAIALSRATLTKVRQNLFFAFVYNVLGIPLAAFGLLDPVIAGAAMAMSSVSVVGNSLRLRRWRPRSAGAWRGPTSRAVIASFREKKRSRDGRDGVVSG
jgi:Cu+-exporting ATPase